MLELACPNCGRMGTVAREKINTRFLCRKCHMPFYLNAQGRAFPGDPPIVPGSPAGGGSEEAIPHRKHERQPAERGRLRGDREEAVGGLGQGGRRRVLVAIVFGWGLWHYLSKPAAGLAEDVEKAAMAMAADDLGYLKSISTPESVADTVKWYDAVHPRFVKARKEWGGRSPSADVMASEDRAGRQGSSEAAIHAPTGTASASPGAAPGATAMPLNLYMVWSLDDEGHWKLNGKETFARFQMLPK